MMNSEVVEQEQNPLFDQFVERLVRTLRGLPDEYSGITDQKKADTGEMIHYFQEALRGSEKDISRYMTEIYPHISPPIKDMEDFYIAGLSMIRKSIPDKYYPALRKNLVSHLKPGLFGRGNTLDKIMNKIPLEERNLYVTTYYSIGKKFMNLSQVVTPPDWTQAMKDHHIKHHYFNIRDRIVDLVLPKNRSSFFYQFNQPPIKQPIPSPFHSLSPKLSPA